MDYDNDQDQYEKDVARERGFPVGPFAWSKDSQPECSQMHTHYKRCS